MRVRMKISLSGTRDGADWPKAGGHTELPDSEAEHLISAGLATSAPEQEPEDEVGEENAAAPSSEEKAVAPRKNTAPRKPPAQK